MDGLAFLVAIVTFVMALVALNKISKLETQLMKLRFELGKLTASRHEPAAALERPHPLSAPEAPVAPASAVETTVPATGTVEEAVTEAPAEHWQPAPATSEAPEEKQAEYVQTRSMPEPEVAPAPAPVRAPDMERAIATRWSVWVGGVAIAIGGLLFVKYAYDNNLIPPWLQIVLGLVLAAVLVGMGELSRRRSTGLTGPNYVPAALSAAGIVTAFGSIYAAYALYQLIAPITAFGGLAAVGLGAFLLSRLEGPLIAALGLLGSYATPMLIPSENPSAWGFFPYLAVILVASFATMRGRNWWWLGMGGLAGSLGWAFLWIFGPYTPADTLPVGLFALFVGLVALFGIEGRSVLKSESGRLEALGTISPALAIGLAGQVASILVLMLLVVRSGHTNLSLSLLAVAVAILVALAWVKQGLSWLAPVGALLMLGVLGAWQEAAFHAATQDEYGNWTWSNAFGPQTTAYLNWMLGCAVAFSTVGVAGVLTRPAPRAWGLLAGGAAALFIGGAWGRVDFLLSNTTWTVISIAAAILLLGTALISNRRKDEPGVDLAAGLLALGAAALLVFAADRMFDRIWLTLAIAVLALLYAGLSKPIAARFMGPLSAGFGTLATLRLFLSRELWADDHSLPLGEHWVLYGYGVPAVLFLIASRLLNRNGHPRSAVALEGISLGLVISLVSLEIRVLITGGIAYEDPRFLEMSAHILTWMGAAYGLIHRQRIYSSFIAKWGARALLVLSALTMVLGTLTSLNPVVTGQPVEGNLIFNSLMLAYLAPVPLIGLIALRLRALDWEVLKPAAGVAALVLAFVYLTLETKLIFQGKLIVPQSLSLGENYAYSAVWLGYALALFVAGIRLVNKYVRLAGLAVMALVVVKVFAWDMSSLGGLYRIASFIGLGLCLIGIGWLYQRFVHHPEDKPA